MKGDIEGRGVVPIPLTNLRIAFVGIGNELNGDDAAGVLAARRLRERLAPAGSVPERALIIEAGPAPESFSGPLRRFQPEMILFIDAAELGEPPGAVRWCNWTEVEHLGASTHTLSPSLFAQFLVRELNCQLYLIAIQPAHLDFDRPVSQPVDQAVSSLVDELAARLV